MIAELVSQYLQHDGFVQTADSFAIEVAQEAASLNQDTQPIAPQTFYHDPHAMQRQRKWFWTSLLAELIETEIRSAILAGNIDQALNLTQTYYPSVLDTNSTILFQLKCRKFIEMMRFIPSTSELDLNNPRTSFKAKLKTGSEMDIDSQETSGQSDENVSNTTLAASDQFQRAIQYGQELTAEYKTHDSEEVSKALNDIFALFAYTDPRHSSAAKLLENTGRLSVAEGLNSAILSNVVIMVLYFWLTCYRVSWSTFNNSLGVDLPADLQTTRRQCRSWRLRGLDKS